MNPTIRQGNQQDIPALTKLCVLLGYEVTETEIADRLKHIMNETDNYVFVVVLEDKAVGFIHIFIKILLEKPIAGEIGALAIDETMQGKGLGKLLVSTAETWAKDKGCQRLVVKSNIMRQDAHAFYQHLGFGISKRQVVFEKSLS